jgi:D-glycero-D-manno-heptose 1,7-bisphosphate phosphatase
MKRELSNRNQSPRRAVFLDKDGTLVHDVPYNVDPALIRFQPGAREALRLLHRAGYALVVVTNQSGVARGYFAETALDGVAAHLRRCLADWQAPLAGFYYCPHHPAGTLPAYRTACPCRKPEPGLLRQAAAELNLDLGRSWLIGDILNDVEAGRRAGCRTILVDSGGETEWLLSQQRLPHHLASNLLEAARIVSALEPALEDSTPMEKPCVA